MSYSENPPLYMTRSRSRTGAQRPDYLRMHTGDPALNTMPFNQFQGITMAEPMQVNDRGELDLGLGAFEQGDLCVATPPIQHPQGLDQRFETVDTQLGAFPTGDGREGAPAAALNGKKVRQHRLKDGLMKSIANKISG